VVADWRVELDPPEPLLLEQPDRRLDDTWVAWIDGGERDHHLRVSVAELRDLRVLHFGSRPPETDRYDASTELLVERQHACVQWERELDVLCRRARAS
jgi:hypothetical protein